jgi:hypothetical protein
MCREQRGERHVDEPADAQQALRRDRLRQLGHNLTADLVHGDSLTCRLRGQLRVADRALTGDEQLSQDARLAQCLADGLRALGEE